MTNSVSDFPVKASFLSDGLTAKVIDCWGDCHLELNGVDHLVSGVEEDAVKFSEDRIRDLLLETGMPICHVLRLVDACW
jgi:hypothetical protein